MRVAMLSWSQGNKCLEVYSPETVSGTGELYVKKTTCSLQGLGSFLIGRP